jgi:hypothetical protein
VPRPWALHFREGQLCGLLLPTRLERAPEAQAFCSQDGSRRRCSIGAPAINLGLAAQNLECQRLRRFAFGTRPIRRAHACLARRRHGARTMPSVVASGSERRCDHPRRRCRRPRRRRRRRGDIRQSSPVQTSAARACLGVGRERWDVDLAWGHRRDIHPCRRRLGRRCRLARAAACRVGLRRPAEGGRHRSYAPCCDAARCGHRVYT